MSEENRDPAPPRPILGAGGDFAAEGHRPSGFGAKFHPFSYDDAREELAPKVDDLTAAVETMPASLRGERVVVEATLLPNYLAASYFPDRLRHDADLVLIGTRAARGVLHQKTKPDLEDARTKTLLFAATEDSVQVLQSTLQTEPEEGMADDIRKFQDIGLPGPSRLIRHRRGEDQPDPDDVIAWESVLSPGVDVRGQLSEGEQARNLEKWKSLVTGLGGEVHEDFRRRVGSLTFVPIEIAGKHLDDLGAFNPLRVIRPMPRLRPFPGQMRSVAISGLIGEPPADSPPLNHRIVSFDGGVDLAHPLLRDFVTEGDLTTEGRNEICVQHGTLVASALLYGNIEPGRPLDTPPAHVDHFRVLPVPSQIPEADGPYWVMDRIVETVKENPGKWPILNLSYGPDAPVDEDDDVDRFTAEMDRLVYDERVICIVAVGNEGADEISPDGEDRVMAPADGVNVIGVGSCDDLHPPSPTRASYSSVGPGRPGLRVQPMGVSFGGSHLRDFLGAAPGDSGFQAASGTSFSAPSVARGVATLLQPMEAVDVNLARAFVAHYAEEPEPRDLVNVGYGRIRSNYDSVLDCGSGTSTLVVRDSIDRGDTKTYPMPYPSTGVPGNVAARWTVSFATQTDPDDAAEYSLSGLECIFRPNEAIRPMSMPPRANVASEKVDLRTDGDRVEELTNAGYKMGAPKSRSGKWIKNEQTLSEDGKWETVMRFEDSLRASSLYRPELWITYFERSGGQLVPTDADITLDFTLIMTVTAPRAEDLYELVLADSRFRVATPLVSTVPTTVTAI